MSEDFALFRTLSAEQRLIAFGAMTRRDLVRGELLVEQGGASDALFLVLHGALAVYRTSHPEPIAELRAGELVGEIGFFANIPRTANVIAIRDTSVLVLTRAAYTTLARGNARDRRGAAGCARAAVCHRDRASVAAPGVTEGAHRRADPRWT
ncbi:cyclic nucleotide-binding domain-containing protein [Bradyrhizobium elkanii]